GRRAAAGRPAPRGPGTALLGPPDAATALSAASLVRVGDTQTMVARLPDCQFLCVIPLARLPRQNPWMRNNLRLGVATLKWTLVRSVGNAQMVMSSSRWQP